MTMKPSGGQEMSEFELSVKSLLEKYPGSPLSDRWEDAVSFGAKAEAKDFFIHDATDAVNIVWLNDDGIRDLVWIPPSADDESPETPQESMFNFAPLRNIVSFEVHEGAGIARSIGPGVQGDFLVQVFVLNSPRGQLYWIANTAEEVDNLRRFLSTVLSVYV